MPCSQCRQPGHNITTCTNWISAIDPSFFLKDNVQKKQVKSYSRKIVSHTPSRIVTMYHGTSLKAAMNIQKEGFNGGWTAMREYVAWLAGRDGLGERKILNDCAALYREHRATQVRLSDPIVQPFEQA